MTVPSDTVGRYRLLEAIGQGATGRVYRALDLELGRHLALKVLSKETGRGHQALARFHREARAAARLQHPNIVTVFELGEVDDIRYIAMELLEGMDLREAIRSQRLPTAIEKMAAAAQVCQALEYAHSKGVIHRDLKPANIHISPSGQVKIMDFGLARRLGDSEITDEGTIMGTPNYMSPEQIQGRKADERSDVFALGAVLYELFSTRKPFEADNLTAVLFKVVHEDPEPLAKWVPDVPAAVVELIGKALAREPDHRFHSASAMETALVKLRTVLASDTAHRAQVGTRRMLSKSESRLPDSAGTQIVNIPEGDSALGTKDLLALVETGRELAGELSLRALLQRILEQATQLSGSTDSSVLLHDETRDFLYVAHSTGKDAERLLEQWGKSSGRGIPIVGSKAGQVFATGQSLIENNLREDPNHFKAIDRDMGYPTTSMVCVPMTVMGKRIGVVELLNKKVGDYTVRDVVLLEHFAAQAGIAVRNARFFNDLMAHMGCYAAWSEEQGPLQILKDVTRPAWKERLTVLFAGMRGFTQLCHVTGEPERVQSILNEFLGMLADAVIGREGIVNRFERDGLIAFFRGPDHALRAVECASDILAGFAAFRAHLDETVNVQLHFLDVGIGVATDDVILGSMGSERVRSFSAVGNAMNLASHLMEEARGGRHILVDKITFREARTRIVDYEGPHSFVLKKPGQDIGHPFEWYHLRAVNGFKEDSIHEGAGGRGTVFISYSRKDRKWLQTLQKHLKPYVRDERLRPWADSEIAPGKPWKPEIKKAIAASNVAVLLVSPDFLDSDFIAENELAPLLQAEKERGLEILWVPLSASAYDETAIGTYQAALDPSHPLDSMSPSDRNKAFVALGKRIKAATGA